MKQKTHQGLSKRIKVTKNKKLLKGKVVNSHLKVKNNANQKVRKKLTSNVSAGFIRRFRKLIKV